MLPCTYLCVARFAEEQPAYVLLWLWNARGSVLSLPMFVLVVPTSREAAEVGR